MRHIFGVVLAISCVFAGTGLYGQSPAPNDPAVEQLERDLWKALSAGDSKALIKLISDDVTDIDDSGVVGTKQRILRNFSSDPGVKFSVMDMKSRKLGDAAVVVGTVGLTYKDGDKEITEYQRYTDTWYSQAKGEWQLVSTQQHTIPAWVARDMLDSELKAMMMMPCTDEPKLKSLNAETPAFVRFQNATSKPVAIQWINYEGKRDATPGQKNMVDAGKLYNSLTFVTHPFVVLDESGKCLAIYQAQKEPGLAIFK